MGIHKMGIHKLNIKMYKVLIVALALAVLPLVLETTSTTTAGVSTVTGSTTLLSASAATGLFAVVGIAKAIGIGLLARELTSRSKRVVSGPSTLGKESSFSIISQLEPAQCYRRLVCDVATGKMPADESDNVILAPFEGASVKDADITSQSFDFLVAAEAGRQLQSVEKCELRYTCPLSSSQLREIFREI